MAKKAALKSCPATEGKRPRRIVNILGFDLYALQHLFCFVCTHKPYAFVFFNLVHKPHWHLIYSLISLVRFLRFTDFI